MRPPPIRLLTRQRRVHAMLRPTLALGDVLASHNDEHGGGDVPVAKGPSHAVVPADLSDQALDGVVRALRIVRSNERRST